MFSVYLFVRVFSFQQNNVWPIKSKRFYGNLAFNSDTHFPPLNRAFSVSAVLMAQPGLVSRVARDSLQCSHSQRAIQSSRASVQAGTSRPLAVS